MTVGEVQRVADDGSARRALLGPSRVALVVSDTLQYGLFRMWGDFVDGRWEAQAEPYESRDAALGWLRG